jgi:GNAT superfamily N-acetyltransferase
MKIDYSDRKNLPLEEIISLYRSNGWSSSDKPELLYNALQNSHSLISAWTDQRLVGLGNAISDGYLVVYYPHLLVRPEYHGRGIGSEIVKRLKENYQGFHQHMLVADGHAIDFYRKCGFTRAGQTEPMWIFAGHDH